MSLNPSGSHHITFCEDAVGKRLEDLEAEEEMQENVEEEKQQDEEEEQQQEEEEEQQRQQQEEEELKKLSEEQRRERRTALQRVAQINTWITAAAVQNGTPVLMYWSGFVWVLYSIQTTT